MPDHPHPQRPGGKTPGRPEAPGAVGGFLLPALDGGHDAWEDLYYRGVLEKARAARRSGACQLIADAGQVVLVP